MGIRSLRAISRSRSSLANLTGETPSINRHDHQFLRDILFRGCQDILAIFTYSSEILSLSTALCCSC